MGGGGGGRMGGIPAVSSQSPMPRMGGRGDSPRRGRGDSIDRAERRSSSVPRSFDRHGGWRRPRPGRRPWRRNRRPIYINDSYNYVPWAYYNYPYNDYYDYPVEDVDIDVNDNYEEEESKKEKKEKFIVYQNPQQNGLQNNSFWIIFIIFFFLILLVLFNRKN